LYSLASPPDSAGWRARLALGFTVEHGHTRLVREGQVGPLAVQRPFYPEGPAVCHVYLLHPPGGLVPGDDLTLHARVAPGAAALLTVPAATKIYRSDGRTARQRQALTVAPGGALEWLPQETILFDGARARLTTRVELAPGAAFLGWDVVCLGRPACGEGFTAGECRQDLEVWQAGRPLLIERAHYAGELLAAAYGLGGHPLLATFVAVGPALDAAARAALLEPLRALRPAAGDRLSVSVVGELLVLRYLGGDAERARAHLEQAWRLVRPHLFSRPAVPPRVWST
jgi:urease accessory protein